MVFRNQDLDASLLIGTEIRGCVLCVYMNTTSSLTMLKLMTVQITSWEIFKEMEISGDLTCLLRNLFVGQEAAVRTLHITIDWFKIGTGV